MKKVLEECIVVGGSLQGDNFLAKSRDRNYMPRIKIHREVTPEGLEVVYLHDVDTDYMEGMNSAGIEDWQKNLLTDPQTSGGLLLACAPESEQEVLDVFKAHGFDDACVIGHVAQGSGIVVS